MQQPDARPTTGSRPAVAHWPGPRPDEAPGRPVVVGEALVDVFPDGSRRPGGAPFNVAWHLRGFGLDPVLITRVGDDADGARLTASLRDWGMEVSGIQVDRERPTGQVVVRLENGQARYEILPDQAWDRIDAAEAERAAGLADGLLCHGSLACRSRPSAQAVEGLRQRARGRLFVDLNLREPWWRAGEVELLLVGARWIKVNGDELREVAGAEGEVLERARRLARRSGADAVLVTLGELGAEVVWRERDHLALPPPTPVEVVDTVGAGDAFTAVALLGLTLGWGARTWLPRALDFAAGVCGVRGAVIEDRAVYRRLISSWEAGP